MYNQFLLVNGMNAMLCVHEYSVFWDIIKGKKWNLVTL